MQDTNRLLDYYLPPEGFTLESLVATTYQVDFEFFEEELLAVAMGVRAPVSRMRAFRSEIERCLQMTDVTVLYDLVACERLARLSPRIDALPVSSRKLHAKISALMWVRSESSEAHPQRWIRLIVGSANLTRQGFRENYECVAAIDYSAQLKGPNKILNDALRLIERIGAESESQQLVRQLERFSTELERLPQNESHVDYPIHFVDADQVLKTMSTTRTSMGITATKTLTIVSPFWPEGNAAADSLLEIIDHLGRPTDIELVCRAGRSHDGKSWTPEFDPESARNLAKLVPSRIFLRPTLPHHGIESETSVKESGDENEDREFADLNTLERTEFTFHRQLHAKVLLVDGPLNSLLYVGSSNCTRRGLGLKGAGNWEAGLIYKLEARQRKRIESLLGLAGERVEVLPDRPVISIPPTRDDNKPAPTFLSAVIAVGTKLAIRFNSKVQIPVDLRLTMEIPSSGDSQAYWLLYRHAVGIKAPARIQVDLATCAPYSDDHKPISVALNKERIVPHVQIEAHWEGNRAVFPVRFDEKESLPLVWLGRKPTEGELIDYFLFGREPGDGENGVNLPPIIVESPPENVVDTRHILSYFIRRFVQAIPGIEAEISRAAYSPRSLQSALRGPTSPLQLAEQVFASLSKPTSPDEPSKTPTAVAFQIVEIMAALLRSRSKLQDRQLRSYFDPVLARCTEMLEQLVLKYEELQQETFQLYRRLLVRER